MTETELKPAIAQATIVRLPNSREFELPMTYAMICEGVRANLSFKAMVASSFMLMFERTQEEFPTLEDLQNMTGAGYSEEWITEGLEELMRQGAAFWYENLGDTHYMLVNDFRKIKSS